jgi:H+/Cl- antiporter ClcA
MLTAVGIVVGLLVWLAPGHAGPDPATTGLEEQPLPLSAIPGLLLVTVIALGGGVSLGPEGPIVIINTSIVVAAVTLLRVPVPPRLAVVLAISATIGALFGTPAAAALMLTGMVAMAKGGGSLWDRLFLPLVAAGAGAVTSALLYDASLSLDTPPMGDPGWIGLVSSIVIASVAVGIGIGAVWLFPLIHRAFHLIRHPFLAIAIGGVVLGALGAIGGPLTLFKGLQQSAELVEQASTITVGMLVLVTIVKLLALLVASSAGFRGGRIFPSVFVGVAIGVLAHTLFPAIPLSLALASGVLGMTLVSARDGWLAIFLGTAISGDIAVLPILCLAILPAWLLISRQPPLMIVPKKRPTPAM